MKDKKAIILMGHGSRVPDASDNMEMVARRLRETGVADIVKTCYMSRLGPHYPATLDACVTEGATEVLLIPYFLHMGLHTRLDIPTMMKEEAKRHPAIRIVFGQNLGFDEALVDIVKKRISASWGFEDVRDIALVERETYPLPPGDLEFVPMPPDEAKRFREEQGHDHGHDHHHH